MHPTSVAWSTRASIWVRVPWSVISTPHASGSENLPGWDPVQTSPRSPELHRSAVQREPALQLRLQRQLPLQLRLELELARVVAPLLAVLHERVEPAALEVVDQAHVLALA